MGAILVDQVAYDKVAGFLTPECFYREEHQKLFGVLEGMAKGQKQIDLLLVKEQLRKQNLIESVGDAKFLAGLTLKAPAAYHIEQHARVLHDKYVQREMIRLASELLGAAYLDFEAMSDEYSKVAQHIDGLMAGKATSKELKPILREHSKEMQRRYELSKDNRLPGINTGLAPLNQLTGGWQGGELIVLAGRPAMGKTAVALKFAKEAAIRGAHTVFFSMEMSDVKLVDRLVCSCGGIDPMRLKHGILTDGEWVQYGKSVGELEKLPFTIDSNAMVNIQYIRGVASSLKRKGKCGLIVVDYLQLIESTSTNRNQNRERDVAEISRGLKVLAKQLDVPIILLCQLSRAVEMRSDKRPILSDLRESGSIEQDADVVIFLFRPAYYDIVEDEQGKSLEGILILIVAKNREGENKNIPAQHSKDMTQINDISWDKLQ